MIMPGPFVVAGLIQPVDGLVDLSRYVDSVVQDGQTWAVPISNGNHLMLLYNKSLIGAPPETTDELITVGKQLTGGDRYGIVWNQAEPFWLIPWLGGFGGEVFAEDGLTPNLNTPPMVATLQFLSDLKNVHGITPQEVDYAGADSLFKDGQAAMIVNGDWALSEYVGILGDDLGIAPLPKVTSTGLFPAPYTSGKYFMIPVDVEGQKRDTIVEFIEYVTNYDNQIRLVTELTRLPALREALDDPLVTGDPILEGSSLQIAHGTPMPSVLEMRCNWDAMKPELISVLTSTKNASDAARDMQASAESCVANL